MLKLILFKFHRNNSIQKNYQNAYYLYIIFALGKHKL